MSMSWFANRAEGAPGVGETVTCLRAHARVTSGLSRTRDGRELWPGAYFRRTRSFCSVAPLIILLPAMSQSKKIQGKIFRGESGAGGTQPPRSTSDPALTISIPKPASSQTPAPAPPKLAKPEAAPSPKQDERNGVSRPFRHRLAEKLKNEYKGAERYRLDQDRERELHWKRWGPYVSDRQWVRSAILLHCASPIHVVTGYCPRGLFCQRRRLESLPSRTCPLARLPVGRGWYRRHLR